MAKATKRLVICLNNDGYEASLERRKIYVALPDPRAEKLGQIRVIVRRGLSLRQGRIQRGVAAAIDPPRGAYGCLTITHVRATKEPQLVGDPG